MHAANHTVRPVLGGDNFLSSLTPRYNCSGLSISSLYRGEALPGGRVVRTMPVPRAQTDAVPQPPRTHQVLQVSMSWRPSAHLIVIRTQSTSLIPPHRVNPITHVGQEVLLVPVAQLEPEDGRNFLGLFREADSAETHSTYL